MRAVALRTWVACGADGFGVGEGELVGRHAGVLVGQRGDGAAQQHDDVGAELGETAALAGAEAFAEADEQEQRGYAPGDAEHGEERAQLVGPDRLEDLGEDVEKSAHVLGPGNSLMGYANDGAVVPCCWVDSGGGDTGSEIFH